MNNIEKYDGPGTILSAHSSKMDFRTLVERGIRPPIAFRTKADLDDWVACARNELKYRPVGERDIEQHVAVVDGMVAGLYYTQVWVRAAYDGYRPALKCQVKFVEGAIHLQKNLEALVHGEDADHAVGRSRIRKRVTCFTYHAF
jgi:hypothetical protein